MINNNEKKRIKAEDMTGNSTLLSKSFNGKDIEGITLKGSIISKCDFSASKIKNCKFIECEFSKVSFAKADVSIVDFNNCSFYSVDFSECQFSYVTFDESCQFFDCTFNGVDVNRKDVVGLSDKAQKLISEQMNELQTILDKCGKFTKKEDGSYEMNFDDVKAAIYNDTEAGHWRISFYKDNDCKYTIDLENDDNN